MLIIQYSAIFSQRQKTLEKSGLNTVFQGFSSFVHFGCYHPNQGSVNSLRWRFAKQILPSVDRLRSSFHQIKDLGKPCGTPAAVLTSLHLSITGLGVPTSSPQLLAELLLPRQSLLPSFQFLRQPRILSLKLWTYPCPAP